jgi:hypothetical protein
MADQLPGDLLELQDLGFHLRKAQIKHTNFDAFIFEDVWYIENLQDRIIGQLNDPSRLQQWINNYRANVEAERQSEAIIKPANQWWDSLTEVEREWIYKSTVVYG